MANPKIEGTHKPIKMAASFSPLNHNNSENIKEVNAETSISMSEALNFFIINNF